MRIGGLQKFSLIDYPEKLSAVIFTQGCNFRCPYCYNPELVLKQLFHETIPESEILEFLKARRTYLEGVVITGGEPTQQGDLLTFLDKIKMLGYFIKLDTNGSHPEVLETVIHKRLVDYIAMDVKAPLRKYDEVVGVKSPVKRVRASIEIIIHSGIKHEFRTTLVKPLCSSEDLSEIVLLIEGAQKYTIQNFRPSDKILDRKLLRQDQYTEAEVNKMKSKWEKRFSEVLRRRINGMTHVLEKITY